MKKGDFVKINYTGKLADGRIFDTTKSAVAKEAGLDGTKSFHPITICIGEGMLLKGLDEAMEGKTGAFTVTLQPEDAFGKKDPKLLQVIPTPQLLKQGIRPYPGLELNVDGKYGIVKRTGGGRTTVDFNHPLASQEVSYDVEIVETVTNPQEQINAILDTAGLPYIDVHVNGESATVHLKQLFPKQIMDAVQEKVTTLTTVKTVSFEVGHK